MTEKQYRLLNDLKIIMSEMANECINEPRYNDIIANLEIFNVDLEEGTNAINDFQESLVE